MVAAGCTSHGSHRSASTTVPRPPGPGPAPSTTVGPSPSSIRWTRDADPSLSIGGGTTATLAAALAPDASATWLLAGWRVGPDDVPTATVWTSANGTTWQAQTLPSPVAGSEASASAQYHDQRVVVGSVGLGADRRAAVWISPRPGAPFTPATVPASTGASSMNSVADGELGFFASGTTGNQIGLWSSTNGQEWSESSTAEQTLASAPAGRIYSMVAQGADVYAGGSVADGNSTDAAVWSSADGIHWRQVDTAQPAFGGAANGEPGEKVIYSLAGLGTDGLVAVGGDMRLGVWSPAWWISSNGDSWSQPSGTFPSHPGGSVARSVASITSGTGGTNVVAVGGTATSQRLWRSSDGLHWSYVALPPGASRSSSWRATLAAVGPAGYLVADGDAGQPHVLVGGQAGWAEPSANPQTFGPVQAVARVRTLSAGLGRVQLLVELSAAPQALGGAPSITSMVLSTTDGRTWVGSRRFQLQTAPRPPSGSTTSVRFGSEWIAAGRAAATAVAWVSRDGIHWTHPVQLPGSGAVAYGICASRPASDEGSGSVVVVGRAGLAGGGTQASAWSSNDGRHWARDAVQPPGIPGGRGALVGCLAVNGGLVAYGEAPGTGGAIPALWRSDSGQVWSIQTVSAFSAGSPAPVSDVVQSGATSIAIGGTPDTGTSMWLSDDGGSTWRTLSPIGAPWVGWEPPVFEDAAFLAGTAVVAGSVDGGLAVWLGSRAG